MTDLTPAQSRVICFMHRYRVSARPRLYSLVELDHVVSLERDDVLTIPSLIERGLVMILQGVPAVSLTWAGIVVAEEICPPRTEGALHDRRAP